PQNTAPWRIKRTCRQRRESLSPRVAGKMVSQLVRCCRCRRSGLGSRRIASQSLSERGIHGRRRWRRWRSRRLRLVFQPFLLRPLHLLLFLLLCRVAVQSTRSSLGLLVRTLLGSLRHGRRRSLLFDLSNLGSPLFGQNDLLAGGKTRLLRRRGFRGCQRIDVGG